MPVRPQHVAPAPPAADRDLGWRVIVHAGDQTGSHTEWHLKDCAHPHDPDAHCDEGRRLSQTLGHPDGHCLVDGQCARCAALQAAA